MTNFKLLSYFPINSFLTYASPIISTLLSIPLFVIIEFTLPSILIGNLSPHTPDIPQKASPRPVPGVRLTKGAVAACPAHGVGCLTFSVCSELCLSRLVELSLKCTHGTDVHG